MATSYHSGRGQSGQGSRSPEGGLQIEVQWYHYVAGAVVVLALCAVLAVGINRRSNRVGAVAPRGATPLSGQDEGQLPPSNRP